MTANSIVRHVRRDGAEIRRGLYFAAAMIVVAVASRVAAASGVSAGAAWAERGLMALIGVYLIVVGNAMPKTLTPIGARLDRAVGRARRMRIAGWTWVLAGLALTASWLILPRAFADPLTLLLMPLAIIVTIAQCVATRRRTSAPGAE